MNNIQAGDILAIRGKGWLSRQILKATGNTVSHVGLVLAEGAVSGSAFVIEALSRVKTDTLSQSIADAEKAYILSPLNLTDEQRQKITDTAAGFSTRSYGYFDIGLQWLDAVFGSRWFTDHLGWGLNDHPICSYVVAASYASIGLTFGKVQNDSITPADIYKFAVSNPTKYSVKEIK